MTFSIKQPKYLTPFEIPHNELKDYVLDSKLVTCKPSKTYPDLHVVKYKPKVHWGGLWDDFNIHMRGLILDKNLKPVYAPFTKVFNFGEPAGQFGKALMHRDEVVTIERKVNGFMAALHRDKKGELIISTTGSLDSDFVGYAKEILYQSKPLMVTLPVLKVKTLLFEICHPSDPHVVPEEIGSYLIGGRDESGYYTSDEDLDLIAILCELNRPERTVLSFSDALKAVKECVHEGFMVKKNYYDQVKLKSPYYLTTKLFGRMKHEKLEDLLLKDKSKITMSEEYWPLIDYLKEHKGHFTSLDEQGKMGFIRDYLGGL